MTYGGLKYTRSFAYQPYASLHYSRASYPQKDLADPTGFIDAPITNTQCELQLFDTQLSIILDGIPVAEVDEEVLLRKMSRPDETK